jgi:IS30 family transposase
MATWWTATRKDEVWERWKAGESGAEIARALGKRSGSIHMVLRATGGIVPPRRCRSRAVLSLYEREEISRGLASGSSMRSIAFCLSRAPSTISREVNRHGGRESYRAQKANECAWALDRCPRDAFWP